MTKTKLPNKSSALIRVAIGDFRKVLRSKRYVVNMNIWHEPNGKCTVCLAGAVMAGTLHATPDVSYEYYDFGKSNKKKMDALDEFRSGFVSCGVSKMRPDISQKRLHAVGDIEHNIGSEINRAMNNANNGRSSWREFIRLMLKLADELEAIKL